MLFRDAGSWKPVGFQYVAKVADEGSRKNIPGGENAIIQVLKAKRSISQWFKVALV